MSAFEQEWAVSYFVLKKVEKEKENFIFST